jgi:hypothetical protein
MATATYQKLRIKPGYTLMAIDAPPDFEQDLDAPDDVRITRSGKTYDQLHWFVRNRADVAAGLQKVLALLRDDVICWIYYPKGSSGMQTDLTRDKGWEALLDQGLTWVNLISFNDTWSAFGMRLPSPADRKKESAPRQPRAIFDYADPQTKTVRIPEDLEKAFKKAKGEKAYFESLAFSHKKEYVEWIVSAKKPETRARRITGTLEMLAAGKKNPNAH